MSPVEEPIRRLAVVPDVDNDGNGRQPPAGPPPPPPAPPGPEPRDPLPGEPLTDLGYAYRLIAKHGHELRYVSAWGKWVIWDGTRWRVDEMFVHEDMMARISRDVGRDFDDDPDVTREQRKVARAREQAGAVRGACHLASVDPRVAIRVEALDSDPLLLNCTNGTLDLRTGELRPHDPVDLLTKLTRVPYDPEADGTLFHAFLERVQPEAEMRAFLARALGTALEGRVVEQMLLILYGVGANGKSTLVDLLDHVLGDYAGPVAPALLMAKSNDAHPTEVADLFGLRLGLVSETAQSRQLDEAQVKRLTSQEDLKARRLYQDFWSFPPSHTIVMSTNHKPVIKGTDDGIWRRLKLVPFPVRIPDEEQDPRLTERLQQEQGSAALSWLVQGYRSWARDGLQEPGAVRTATQEYRFDSDNVGRFVDEMCYRTGQVRSSFLWAAWERWCDGEGVEAGSAADFKTALTSIGGVTAKRETKGVIYRGLALRAERDEES